MMKRLFRINIFVGLIFLVRLPIALAQPIISYSNTTITIQSGTAYSQDIAEAISDLSVFNRTGSTATLSAHLIIEPGAQLIISNETWLFNGEYTLMNFGDLTIEKSTITSVNPSSRGRIASDTRKNSSPYSFKLTDSVVSYLGSAAPNPPNYTGSIYGATAFAIGNKPWPWGMPGNQEIITGNEIFNIQGIMSSWAIVKNNIFHNLERNGAGLGSYCLDIGSGEFKNNVVWDSDLIVLLVSWGGQLNCSDNKFYHNRIPGNGCIIEVKEGEQGPVVRNNEIYDNTYGAGGGAAIAVLGSTKKDWTYIEDNYIHDWSGDGIHLQANGYLGSYILKTSISGNRLDKLSGAGIRFFGHGNFGMANETGTDVYTNANQITNCGRGFVIDGTATKNIILKNDFIANSLTEDIRFGLFWPVSDLTAPIFINLRFDKNKTRINGGRFLSYIYLDVQVVDINSNPINGATVTVANNVDASYPAIDMYQAAKTSFSTGVDGHTPLPQDPANSAAILDFWKTSTTQQEMTYTVTASYSGYTSSTTVTPDASWYRIDPNTYQNTVVITLPMILTSSAIDINLDGTIDISDLRLVALHFGETTTLPYPRYDVNTDGIVDILDLRQVAGGM